jgi:DNA transformation protein
MPQKPLKEIVQYYHDVLESHLGYIDVKRMFGGHGFYFENKIFAIEAFGELYLKGESKVCVFEPTDVSRQFVYEKGETSMRMRYWYVPESILYDPDMFSKWLHIAVKYSNEANK